MTSLVAPRYELIPTDPTTGRFTREWYQFLVNLAKASGPSSTGNDDTQLRDNLEAAALDASALTARRMALEAANLLLFAELDAPKATDVTLLAWWPGDPK